MASVLVISGPNEGDYYPLGQRTMVVGRGENCPIQIVDDLVSRRHVQLHFKSDAGRHFALDMRSANGMFINGRRIHGETALEDGDVIEVGESKIMFTTADYEDRESALSAYKKRGHRGKSTIVR